MLHVKIRLYASKAWNVLILKATYPTNKTKTNEKLHKNKIKMKTTCL